MCYALLIRNVNRSEIIESKCLSQFDTNFFHDKHAQKEKIFFDQQRQKWILRKNPFVADILVDFN